MTEPIAIIMPKQLFYGIHILLEVGNKERPMHDGIGDGLGNLRLSAPGDRTRLMTESALRRRADQAPLAGVTVLFQPHLETGRHDVGASWIERQNLNAVLIRPAYGLLIEVDLHIFRNIADIRIGAIDSIAFRLHLILASKRRCTCSKVCSVSGRCVGTLKYFPRSYWG